MWARGRHSVDVTCVITTAHDFVWSQASPYLPACPEVYSLKLFYVQILHIDFFFFHFLLASGRFKLRSLAGRDESQMVKIGENWPTLFRAKLRELKGHIRKSSVHGFKETIVQRFGERDNRKAIY